MPIFTPRRWMVFLLALVVHAASPAQTRESMNLPDASSLRNDIRAQSLSGLRAAETRTPVPMDAPLNPAEYPVGPGDELALNIWSGSPIEYRLVVTPEGTLLIPTVGRVGVGDATLDSLKKRVTRLVEKKYLSSDVSLTLLTPRKVVVQISGFVLGEGRKEVYATQRVNDLIAMSSTFPTEKLTVEQYGDQIRRLYNQASERRIILKRRDGQVIHVDLARYRATGDGRYNPYLKEGDVVFVPEKTLRDVQIGVYGAVTNSASFEYVSGDSLSAVIAMALGFKPNSDPEHAILTRLTPGAEQIDTVRVNALAVARGLDPDIPLRPGDRLVIPGIPELRLDYHVTVIGEVLKQGDYPISRRSTRLADILHEAGGVTPLANLHAATILRLRESEAGNAVASNVDELMSRRSPLMAMDTAYYNTETALRLMGEFVTVDFSKLMEKGDSAQNVLLNPFDRITIPARSSTVYVFGQVVQPGHVPLADGKNYKYYIDRTGGFTEEARTGDVKVIKGGTRVWLDPSETTVEDGDLIWVPKEVQYPFTYYMTIYSQIAEILGAIATVALLVKTF